MVGVRFLGLGLPGLGFLGFRARFPVSGFPDFWGFRVRVLGLGSSNHRFMRKSSHPKLDELRSQGLAALGFLGSEFRVYFRD